MYIIMYEKEILATATQIDNITHQLTNTVQINSEDIKILNCANLDTFNNINNTEVPEFSVNQEKYNKACKINLTKLIDFLKWYKLKCIECNECNLFKINTESLELINCDDLESINLNSPDIIVKNKLYRKALVINENLLSELVEYLEIECKTLLEKRESLREHLVSLEKFSPYLEPNTILSHLTSLHAYFLHNNENYYLCLVGEKEKMSSDVSSKKICMEKYKGENYPFIHLYGENIKNYPAEIISVIEEMNLQAGKEIWEFNNTPLGIHTLGLAPIKEKQNLENCGYGPLWSHPALFNVLYYGLPVYAARSDTCKVVPLVNTIAKSTGFVFSDASEAVGAATGVDTTIDLNIQTNVNDTSYSDNIYWQQITTPSMHIDYSGSKIDITKGLPLQYNTFYRLFNVEMGENMFFGSATSTDYSGNGLGVFWINKDDTKKYIDENDNLFYWKLVPEETVTNYKTTTQVIKYTDTFTIRQMGTGTTTSDIEDDSNYLVSSTSSGYIDGSKLGVSVEKNPTTNQYWKMESLIKIDDEYTVADNSDTVYNKDIFGLRNISDSSYLYLDRHLEGITDVSSDNTYASNLAGNIKASSTGWQLTNDKLASDLVEYSKPITSLADCKKCCEINPECTSFIYMGGYNPMEYVLYKNLKEIKVDMVEKKDYYGNHQIWAIHRYISTETFQDRENLINQKLFYIMDFVNGRVSTTKGQWAAYYIAYDFLQYIKGIIAGKPESEFQKNITPTVNKISVALSLVISKLEGQMRADGGVLGLFKRDLEKFVPSSKVFINMAGHIAQEAISDAESAVQEVGTLMAKAGRDMDKLHCDYDNMMSHLSYPPGTMSIVMWSAGLLLAAIPGVGEVADTALAAADAGAEALIDSGADALIDATSDAVNDAIDNLAGDAGEDAAEDGAEDAGEEAENDTFSNSYQAFKDSLTQDSDGNDFTGGIISVDNVFDVLDKLGMSEFSDIDSAISDTASKLDDIQDLAEGSIKKVTKKVVKKVVKSTIEKGVNYAEGKLKTYLEKMLDCKSIDLDCIGTFMVGKTIDKLTDEGGMSMESIGGSADFLNVSNNMNSFHNELKDQTFVSSMKTMLQQKTKDQTATKVCGFKYCTDILEINKNLTTQRNSVALKLNGMITMIHAEVYGSSTNLSLQEINKENSIALIRAFSEYNMVSAKIFDYNNEVLTLLQNCLRADHTAAGNLSDIQLEQLKSCSVLSPKVAELPVLSGSDSWIKNFYKSTKDNPIKLPTSTNSNEISIYVNQNAVEATPETTLSNDTVKQWSDSQMFKFTMDLNPINGQTVAGYDKEIEKSLTVTQKAYFIASWIKMQDRTDTELIKLPNETAVMNMFSQSDTTTSSETGSETPTPTPTPTSSGLYLSYEAIEAAAIFELVCNNTNVTVKDGLNPSNVPASYHLANTYKNVSRIGSEWDAMHSTHPISNAGTISKNILDYIKNNCNSVFQQESNNGAKFATSEAAQNLIYLIMGFNLDGNCKPIISKKDSNLKYPKCTLSQNSATILANSIHTEWLRVKETIFNLFDPTLNKEKDSTGNKQNQIYISYIMLICNMNYQNTFKSDYSDTCKTDTNDCETLIKNSGMIGLGNNKHDIDILGSSDINTLCACNLSNVKYWIPLSIRTTEVVISRESTQLNSELGGFNDYEAGIDIIKAPSSVEGSFTNYPSTNPFKTTIPQNQDFTLLRKELVNQLVTKIIEQEKEQQKEFIVLFTPTLVETISTNLVNGLTDIISGMLTLNNTVSNWINYYKNILIDAQKTNIKAGDGPDSFDLSSPDKTITELTSSLSSSDAQKWANHIQKECSSIAHIGCDRINLFYVNLFARLETYSYGWYSPIITKYSLNNTFIKWALTNFLTTDNINNAVSFSNGIQYMVNGYIPYNTLTNWWNNQNMPEPDLYKTFPELFIDYINSNSSLETSLNTTNQLVGTQITTNNQYIIQNIYEETEQTQYLGWCGSTGITACPGSGVGTYPANSSYYLDNKDKCSWKFVLQNNSDAITSIKYGDIFSIRSVENDNWLVTCDTTSCGCGLSVGVYNKDTAPDNVFEGSAEYWKFVSLDVTSGEDNKKGQVVNVGDNLRITNVYILSDEFKCGGGGGPSCLNICWHFDCGGVYYDGYGVNTTYIGSDDYNEDVSKWKINKN